MKCYSSNKHRITILLKSALQSEWVNTSLNLRIDGLIAFVKITFRLLRKGDSIFFSKGHIKREAVFVSRRSAWWERSGLSRERTGGTGRRPTPIWRKKTIWGWALVRRHPLYQQTHHRLPSKKISNPWSAFYLHKYHRFHLPEDRQYPLRRHR